MSTPDAPNLAPESNADRIVAVPVRHYGRWLGGAAVLLLLLDLGFAVARNKNFKFGLVPHYLFDPVILTGLKTTLELTVIAMAVAIGLGVIAAVFRLSPNPVLKATSGTYIWFFRGTPVLVQLIFWFNLGIIFPRIRLGIPFTDLTLWSAPTNDAIRPLTAAILGLGLNEGAYVAEIVRAGIISVGKGQTDAAAALGMRRSAVMRRVVLPQAVPVVIPPMGNEFIGMLKYSALASVIAVEELLGSVERIYSTNLRTLELLVVASIWYLACTTALTIGQHYLERYVGRSRATPQATAGWRIWTLRRAAH
ncbi:MAG: amino acid ABC transporter permease [Actinobacteria bacterium]|nr:amino acid ABC transporter permease [Actinomycetota bacterium]